MPRMVSETALRKRGWTKAQISALGVPDARLPNGARLYKPHRVKGEREPAPDPIPPSVPAAPSGFSGAAPLAVKGEPVPRITGARDGELPDEYRARRIASLRRTIEWFKDRADKDAVKAHRLESYPTNDKAMAGVQWLNQRRDALWSVILAYQDEIEKLERELTAIERIKAREEKKRG